MGRVTQCACRTRTLTPTLACAADNNIAKPQWWDTLQSGGCIVEQATHFVDAMRYLSKSEFRRESILALGVGPDMPLAHMAPPPAAEHTVRRPLHRPSSLVKNPFRVGFLPAFENMC